MFSTPASAKYINDIANKLLNPIKRGESVFVRWFPGHGKTAILNQILSDRKLLNKHIGVFAKRFFLSE